MYKAIGFDWGGVIVASKPIVEGIAEILGITKSELLTVYYKYNHLANVESMSYSDLWAKIITELGFEDKIDEVRKFRETQQTFEMDHRMIELIDEIRSNGYKTGLLSNNTRENGDRMRQDGLHNHFDAFLISAEIGYMKPNVEAFNILFEELGVLPSEAVFIDDSESSLSHSDQIGYTPILFTGYENLKSELINLGVIS